MPNTETGIEQHLVAAASIVSDINRYPNSLLDGVHMDFEAIEKEPGNAAILNINVPRVSEADVENIAGGPLRITNAEHDTYPIVVDHKESVSKLLPSWTQIRTPQRLADLYLGPQIESLLRKINRVLSNLFTPGNFDVYAIIEGAGADAFLKSDFKDAMKILDKNGVPIHDTPNMMFATDTDAFWETFAADGFTQNQIVGQKRSEQAIEMGQFLPVFGVRPFGDPMIPLAEEGKNFGVVYHRSAVGMKTVLLPPPEDAPHVKVDMIYPRENLPVQVSSYWDQQRQGRILTVQAGFGVKVLRKERAAAMKTA